MQDSPGRLMIAAVQRMINEALRQARFRSTQIDGQFGMSQMPPGAVSLPPDDPDGGTIIPGPHGHVAGDISDFNAAVLARVLQILEAGTNVTLTVSGGKIIIASTGGGGTSSGPQLVTTTTGDVVQETDGDFVTSY